MWELWGGVEISAFPLTSYIAYCYRTSRDSVSLSVNTSTAAIMIRF